MTGVSVSGCDIGIMDLVSLLISGCGCAVLDMVTSFFLFLACVRLLLVFCLGTGGRSWNETRQDRERFSTDVVMMSSVSTVLF